MIDLQKCKMTLALEWLYRQWGKDYIYGVENDAIDAANAWDCSELTQSCFNRIVDIKLPDGAKYQRTYCREQGRLIRPNEPVQPLDLVFLWDSGMREINHVAIVFGDIAPVGGDLLIEARGKPFNKVMFTPLGLFQAQFGSRMAGIYRLINIIQ